MTEKLKFTSEKDDYYLLKSVSLENIIQAWDGDCTEFVEELGKLLIWLNTNDYPTTRQLHQHTLVTSAAISHSTKWKDFLIAHGFIEKVKEETYSIGDRLRIPSSFSEQEYLICVCARISASVDYVQLSNVITGAHWMPAFPVKNNRKITRRYL